MASTRRSRTVPSCSLFPVLVTGERLWVHRKALFQAMRFSFLMQTTETSLTVNHYTASELSKWQTSKYILLSGSKFRGVGYMSTLIHKKILCPLLTGNNRNLQCVSDNGDDEFQLQLRFTSQD